MSLRISLMSAACLLGMVTAVPAGVYVNNKASTVGESHARGLSDVVRSRGQYELDSSQAAINRTEVRSRELDNNLKAANTYFEMRNVNREQRFGTPEEKYARKVANEQRYFRHAQRGSPDGLTPSQLDPITGKISWPFALMPEPYKDNRDQLDSLFEQRARHGGQISYSTYTEIKKATDDFLAALNRDIKSMETKDYMTGKHFINALADLAEQSG